MGDKTQEDDELIIVDDPTGDTINYWTSLVDETKKQPIQGEAESQVEVNFFENYGALNRNQKPKRRDVRKRLKTILENSPFPQDETKRTIECYVENAELMNLSIDRLDPKTTVMFDLESEGWITAGELEKKGLLRKPEEIEFDKS